MHCITQTVKSYKTVLWYVLKKILHLCPLVQGPLLPIVNSWIDIFFVCCLIWNLLGSFAGEYSHVYIVFIQIYNSLYLSAYVQQLHVINRLSYIKLAICHYFSFYVWTKSDKTGHCYALKILHLGALVRGPLLPVVCSSIAISWSALGPRSESGSGAVVHSDLAFLWRCACWILRLWH